MKNLNFITFFSKEFLIQGTAALKSFKFYHPASNGFVVCLDSEAYNLLKLNVFDSSIEIFHINQLNEIEKIFKVFLDKRTFAESIISIKPIMIQYFLQMIPYGESIIYFDADIFFFNSLDRVDYLITNNDLIMSKHLFPNSMTGSVIYGKYNGGFIIFKNSEYGLLYLSNWLDLCIEWCELKLFENKFADQKYLDSFESKPGVYSLIDPGINIGQSFFLDKQNIVRSRENQLIFINGFSLVAFHFHGFRVSNFFLLTGFNRYGNIKKRLNVMFQIYMPYIRSIWIEIQNYAKISPTNLDNFMLTTSSSSFLHLILQIIKFSKFPIWQSSSRVIRR